VERAWGTHAKFALAPFAFAPGFSVVGWAEPAGETADADFDVIDFHRFPFLAKLYLLFGSLSILVFWLRVSFERLSRVTVVVTKLFSFS
jgi:hypothetical protein